MPFLEKYIKSLKIFFSLIAVLWVVHLVTSLIPLQQFGLKPRTVSGLLGILTSPFLHANFCHLIANTIGLFTFGIIIAFLEKEDSLIQIIIEITIFQGVLLWLFGRSCNHIGASGLVFGLFGYLVLIGYFQRKIKTILISLLVVFFYGGTIFGILPTNFAISWEGHLFGFLVGAKTAKGKFFNF